MYKYYILFSIYVPKPIPFGVDEKFRIERKGGYTKARKGDVAV